MQDEPGQQAEENDARPGAQAALDAGKGRRCGRVSQAALDHGLIR